MAISRETHRKHLDIICRISIYIDLLYLHYFYLENNTAAASVFRKGCLDPSRIQLREDSNCTHTIQASLEPLPIFHCWTEVEFLLQKQNDVIPVEVKAGRRSHSRSAGTFAGKYDPPEIIKLGYWNFRKRGITRFIPLYAASMLKPQFTEKNPQTHF